MLRRVAVAFALLFAACGGGSDPSRDDIEAAIDRQLTENRQSLPNDTASETPVLRRTLAAFVEDYQSVGFFRGENPAVAARRIARDFEREFGEAPPLATRLDELTLLRYDRRRAWFEDLERDVVEGNDAYVDAFAEWSRISRGAFRPHDVRERWAGEEGPVTITFTLAGARHEVEAASQGDFLDLCVLTAGINPLIAPSGRQFAVYRPDAALGQEAFVVALTRHERTALERRGWHFATPEEVRLAFGYGRLYEEGTATPCA
jgi:hypothetical protein